MCQEKVINDLFDAGVKNDKFALLHKVNQVNKVAVKTPKRLLERKEVNNINCQGEPWGPNRVQPSNRQTRKRKCN